DREFAKRDEAARHGPIRTPTRVVFAILEFVGDSQLQKEQEARRKPDRHGSESWSVGTAQQRREAQGRETERGDERRVRRNRKPFSLIDPPSVRHGRRPPWNRTVARPSASWRRAL